MGTFGKVYNSLAKRRKMYIMERKKTVRESVSGEGRKCGWRKAMFNSQQKRQALRTILGAVLTAANGALFALMWFHFYKMKMYIFPFFAKGVF